VREELGMNNKFYIGPLSEAERDVIDYLRLNHRASVTDLSLFSGMEKETASNLIDGLISIRVIKEENGDFISI
jgi:hypothetical protein